ncbi:MAG: membrane protein insertion efficiency factor YidD [Myxococcaceae bacterium]|nr:MAG: membrane protein insertion efficiency factor YidD [Myxococcaceae bacterium]
MARRNAPGGGGPSECQRSQFRGAGARRGRPADRVREKSPLKLLALLLALPIHLYRWTVSPLLPRACRFHPSCSAYAVGALREHGPFRGFWLALVRLGRCNPFNPGGLDPVPPRPGRI